MGSNEQKTKPQNQQQRLRKPKHSTDDGNGIVTLADVGKLAGVSPSTVSRVISNRTPVSPEVREIVERAIVRLGYVPNRAARNLATNRSDSFGVVITQPVSQWGSDPFVAPLLFGIAEGLSETDIQLVLIMASTPRDEERVQRYVQKRHVDGVIVVGSHATTRCWNSWSNAASRWCSVAALRWRSMWITSMQTTVMAQGQR